ncbi:MAG TPA: hydroxyacylglutathione hydrolase C-terminal domain-containing protein [Rubrivivax sp.]|nr:hydroxyacylglutathione hydrolase C-terminal domain-containing protein [Rubrivivax sp.]
MGRERQINPFLRCDAPEVVAAARAQGATSNAPVAVFTTLREWKNRFR